MGVELSEEDVEKRVSPANWAVRAGSWVLGGVFDGDRSGIGSWLERQDWRLTAGKAHERQARDLQIKLGKE